MSQHQHYETAPEDKISIAQKLIYGAGAFVNNLLAAAIGGMAIVIGAFTICVGILPAIFLKERYQQRERKPQPATTANTAVSDQQATTVSNESIGSEAIGAEKPPAGIADFFRGFATTIKFRPFLSLCAATFLVFNGYMMVASFQNYVIIYYVFGGDQSLGAEYVGWSVTVSAISTFGAIFVVKWLSTKLGKRRAFFIAIGISIIGYALKWFCYTPANPLLLLLPAPLMAFGLGGLFTLMGSMIADVCDMDELQTHQRREGMFGSIYWWVVKLGMAVALGLGGFLLNATGFDVALAGNQSEDTIFMMRLFDALIPMACSAIAIWMIATYPITEEKAHQIRLELEQRRGQAAVSEDNRGGEQAELVPG